jgi:hypothetical protein
MKLSKIKIFYSGGRKFSGAIVLINKLSFVILTLKYQRNREKFLINKKIVMFLNL